MPVQPYIGQVNKPGTSYPLYGGSLTIQDANGQIATYSTHSVQTAKLTLTAAQVKALFTTPMTLIAAPGAGYIIDVIDVMGYLNYGTTQFTGANDVNIQYTNGSGAAATGVLSHNWLNGSASAAVKAVGVAVTPVANAAIVVAVGTANPGAGDSTVVIEISYRVVKLP